MGLRDKLAALMGDDTDALSELDELFAQPTTSTDFDVALPGSATEMLEVFSDEEFAVSKPDADGLIWAPIMRAGLWALRPGPNGQKRRVPLQIVAGNSKDQRKEMGLADIVDAHNDGAVENVTVPTSHGNHVLENTGYVDKLKIVDLEVAKGPSKGTKMAHLVGGYRITEPDIKGKMQRGTIAGRSGGILYDYQNTETGKTYPAVLEHVALTNKPWLTGMQSFGRKLAMSQNVETVGMIFSDEAPADEQTSIMDSDEFATETGTGTIAWNHEDSPSWLAQQVNQTLDQARQDKQKAARDADPSSYVYQELPYYRCVEANPTAALVSDGYGDGSNHWVVPLTVTDGTVEVPQFSDWEAVKKVFVPDDREPPPAKAEPLAEPTAPKTLKERLAEASDRRRARMNPTTDDTFDTTNHPEGGDENMSDINLSDAAKAEIAELREKLAKSEADRTSLSEKVDRLFITDKAAKSEKIVAQAKGLFGEDQSGILAFVRKVCLADDGEVAVTSETFSEDGKTEVAYSASDLLSQFFSLIKTGEDGKVALGEQVPAPVEGETVLDENGKPVLKVEEPGKPAKNEGENGGEKLSAEERAQKQMDALAGNGMKFSDKTTTGSAA